MNIIVCGGTGFIGRNLIPALLSQKHSVTVLGRDVQKIQSCFQKTVQSVEWAKLNTLYPDDFDAVINLAGESIASSRWTNAAKQKILNSRITATQDIVNWCASSLSTKPHLYNASSIGVYGLQAVGINLPDPLSESHPITWGVKIDFLSEVGQTWEATAKQIEAKNHQLTLMRFAVVLQRNEAILKKLHIPFMLGLGSRLGTGSQAFTWIHIEDLIRGILFLLQHPEITGAINLCAPFSISQKVFAKTLADVMHRPMLLSTPSFIIKALFGQMGEELLLGGQNIYPQRLLKANFRFKYPTIYEALKQEWS